jgi:hypothetical protein
MGLERAWFWLCGDSDSEWHNQTRALWGAVALGLLLLLPDAALFWWPFRWQATRASWWGVLWPAWWPRGIPIVAALRGVVAVGLARGWGEVWYLVQRLRTEVMAPTASGAAYNSADLTDLDIPGVWNPHRYYEEAEPEPEPQPSRNREIPFNGKPKPALAFRDATPATVSGGNGHGHSLPLPTPPEYRDAGDITAQDVFEGWEERQAQRYVETYPPDPALVEFPVALFVSETRAEDWAQHTGLRVAAGSRLVSANAMHPHYCSEGNSRKVGEWLEAHGYCHQLPGNKRLLTDDGVALLSEVAEGRWREWQAERTAAE